MRQQMAPEAVITFDRTSPNKYSSASSYRREISLRVSPDNRVVDSQAANAQHKLADGIDVVNGA